MNRLTTLLLGVALFVSPLTGVSAAPGDLLFELQSPDPIVFDTFAYNLSTVGDGSRVLIGSPFDDTGAVDTGAAYMFDTMSGRLVNEFLNPTPERGNYYGKAVNSIGNLAMIGSAGENRVFLRDLDTTEVVRYIEGFASGDYFGHALAPVGSDRILIGALKEDASGPTSGGAYLFDIEGNYLFTLANPSPDPEDYFGGVVAANEQLLVVGAEADDTVGQNSGAAYVYDAATGELLHTLYVPQAVANEGFGSSLGVVGERVFVGGPYATTTTEAGGSELVATGAVFEFDGRTGELLRTIANPDGVDEAEFGLSLTLRNNLLLVGTPQGDPDRQTGAAYLFDATTGQLLLEVEGPAFDNRDRFGDSVAIANHRLVIGAPYDDRPAVKAGVAYIFASIPEPATMSAALVMLMGLAFADRRRRVV